MRVALWALAGCLLSASSWAQPIRAVTESGDSVVLFAEGVWVPDDGTVVLPPIREGQRHDSEWFRYGIWVPQGWTPMNAVEAYYDGEIAFVPGGNRDSVVVTMEYVPMESTPMEEGKGRQLVTNRYMELFGRTFPILERSVAGYRVSTILMDEADPNEAARLSAVTAPGGAVLINVYVEGTGAPLEAIANRFLQGLEIESVEDPDAFLRDPCEVYVPLRNGFALDVPQGWDVYSSHDAGGIQVFDIELEEQDPSPEGKPAVAFVITASADTLAGQTLDELAESMVSELLVVEEAEADWNVFSTGPWPPGSPTERADRTYLSPDGKAVLDVAVLRHAGRLALAAVAADNTSPLRYGLSELVDGVRVCR